MNFAKIYNPKSKKISHYRETSSDNFDLKLEDFLGEKIFLFENFESNSFDTFELKSSDDISTTNQEYCDMVGKMINDIKDGIFSKLVGAQKQVQSGDFSQIKLDKIFQDFVEYFPDTFVYLFYVDHEVWMGASPEIVGIMEGNQFSTISLAGTRNREEFTQKERDEQQIVSETISAQINLKMDSSATRILNYGNLRHLINEYHTSVDSDFDFGKKIHEIHPSPALVGYPKQESVDYISKNETIKREMYCGLVHQIESTQYQYSFALIRCAKITKNQVVFYAGAGIITESNPQEEWKETIEKINTLFNVIMQ